jgi:hypothetical protein
MPWLIEDDEFESVQRRLAGATHERMLREMLETLEAIGVETPVVLVLEDLHWSDPSTIDVLEAVAKRREPVRLLVLGTYRRGEAIAQDHPVHRLEQSLRSRGLCAQVALGGLADDALDEYAAAVLGGSAPAGLGGCCTSAPAATRCSRRRCSNRGSNRACSTRPQTSTASQSTSRRASAT